MSQFVIVTGSPGAGKTSIVKGIKIQGCKVVNVGSLMLIEAKRLGYTDDRDKIRYLKEEKINKIRTKALLKISRMRGNIIIDTHNFVEEHGRFIPGMPLDLISKLNKIKAFIYVDAPEKEVINRRKKDTNRIREIEDKEIIKAQKVLNLAVMAYYSSRYNIPVYIIENKTGKLHTSIKKFRTIISEVFNSSK